MTINNLLTAYYVTFVRVRFSVEFVLRLVSCPSKRGFCRDIMNIFDVLAILPFFIALISMQVTLATFLASYYTFHD